MVTVRVIRTWETRVEAEYGDTDEDLQSKVTEGYLDSTTPDAETRVILEHAESEFETRAELEKIEEAELQERLKAAKEKEKELIAAGQPITPPEEAGEGE